MSDPLEPKSATGLDRRQVLSAAAGLAATLGISASAISPAFAAAKPRRSQLVGPFDSFRDYIRALDERGLLLRVPRLDQDQYELDRPHLPPDRRIRLVRRTGSAG